MKNDLDSLDKEMVTCLYKGTIVEIPLRIFLAEAFGYHVFEKKFIRYRDGPKIFGLSQSEFNILAHEANAVYKIKKMALVKVQDVMDYLEYFREVN